MKVEKILDGFVEYSDFLDNVLIGKTKDGYLTFIQKDDYTIIDKNMLNDKIVKIRKLTGSNFVECKDVNGYITLRRSSHPFSIPTRTMDNKKIVSISSMPGKHYMVAKSENGDIYIVNSNEGFIFTDLPIAKSIKDVSINKYEADDPDYIILETKESTKLLIKFYWYIFDKRHRTVTSSVILNDRLKKLYKDSSSEYYVYTNYETGLKTLVDKSKEYKSINEWHNDWVTFENDRVLILADKISSEYKYKLFNIKSCTQFDMDFYSIIYPISPKLLLIGNEKDKLNLFEIVDNKMIKRIFKKDTYIKIQDIDLREDGTVFVIADGSTYRLS